MIPFGQLSLWLAEVGLILILSGTVWVQLIRRTQSIRVQRGIGKISKTETVATGRGVEAIFTSDRDWRTDHPSLRTLLVDVGAWAIFLVGFALLVQVYNSDIYLQSWVRNNLGFGAYVLDYSYYALFMVSTLAGLPVYRMLYWKWKASRP